VEGGDHEGVIVGDPGGKNGRMEDGMAVGIVVRIAGVEL
jgi:hypothetical protein